MSGIAERQKKELHEYIKRMENRGYSTQVIREQLEKHNYPKAVIEAALKGEHLLYTSPLQPDEADPKDQLTPVERLFIVCSGISLLSLALLTGLVTNASVLVVSVSFIPSFMTIVISYIVFGQSKRRWRYIIWLVPAITLMLYIYLAQSGLVPPLLKTSIGNIAVLNGIIMVVFLLILTSMFEPAAKKVRVKEYYKTQVKKPAPAKKRQAKKMEKEQLEEYMHGNGDKSKALNFAIGRVYSMKHGGTKELRDRIKIDSEWYKTFNSVKEAGTIRQHLPQLRDLLHQMYDRLMLFHNKEHEVFGHDTAKLKLLTRDPQGNSRIIDVLTVNDAEPVQTYYQGALDFCRKALNELEQLAGKA